MIVQLNLGKTETYVSRPAVWIKCVGVAVDGCLTITCVKKNGDCDGPHTYGVVKEQGRFIVWKLPEDGGGPLADIKAKQSQKQRPYTVTIQGDDISCTCRSRDKCKHGDGIRELLSRKLI